MNKAILILSLLLIPLQTYAQDRKMNSTMLHVNDYGKKTDKIKEGVLANNFTAYISNGKKVSLSDFKNKKNVLLIFYPGDETPGCTKQLSDIRDNYKELQKLDIEVFGINPATKESHKSFIDKNNFPFELVIDNDKKIAKEYDALNFLGFISRTVVLINKKGEIVLYKKGMPDLLPKELSKLL